MSFRGRWRLAFSVGVCGIALAVVAAGVMYATMRSNAVASDHNGRVWVDPPAGVPSPGWTSPSPGGSSSTPEPVSAGRHQETPQATPRSVAPIIGGGNVPRQDPVYALASSLVAQARSVSTLVTAPAGVPVTGPVSISILYPNNYRSTQDYQADSGNRFVYDLPEGDGTRQDEKLTVSLAEHGPSGTVLAAVYLPLTVEPRYDVTVSPLTFTLIDDCDIIGSSEPTILWADDRGGFEADLDLSAGDSAVVSRFARTLTDVGVADDLQWPYLTWYDQDPGDFIGHPSSGVGPLLPGSGSVKDYTEQAQQGGPCLGEIKYSVTIRLLTYSMQ